MWFVDDQSEESPTAGQVPDRCPLLVGQPMGDEFTQPTISSTTEYTQRDIAGVGQLPGGLGDVLQEAGRGEVRGQAEHHLKQERDTPLVLNDFVDLAQQRSQMFVQGSAR